MNFVRVIFEQIGLYSIQFQDENTVTDTVFIPIKTSNHCGDTYLAYHIGINLGIIYVYLNCVRITQV